MQYLRILVTRQTDRGWKEMSEQQIADVAAQVRRARKARGLTVKEMAREAGVADGTITRVETGQKVRPGNLRAVLDALGITAAPIGGTPAPEDVQLALDLVEKWLLAVPVGEDRERAVRELIRWITITHG